MYNIIYIGEGNL